MALLRFAVHDEDVFGDATFIGQAVYPVPCIRTGYSSIQLKNAYNEELDLGSLLVHVEIVKTYADEEVNTTARYTGEGGGARGRRERAESEDGCVNDVIMTYCYFSHSEPSVITLSSCLKR